MKRTLKVVATTVALVLGAGLVVFHPSRPLYMEHRGVEVTMDDSVVLRGTLSKPRWKRKPLPGVVLVHGSGPLTREHVRGDTRSLVRSGFAVLAYDKRGAGASSGVYMRSAEHPPEVLLGRLAADAAAMFDRLATDADVDTARLGFFGASQAGWIIPLAAERTRFPSRFHVMLSGPAVSTGVEQYFSDLTGDGNRPPRVADRAEVERLVRRFSGNHGFNPAPLLAATRVPTLWLLGDHDASVPTFATVHVLDSIRAAGNDRHTVVRYPNANHALRDIVSGEAVPIWEQVVPWMRHTGIVSGNPD